MNATRFRRATPPARFRAGFSRPALVIIIIVIGLIGFVAGWTFNGNDADTTAANRLAVGLTASQRTPNGHTAAPKLQQVLDQILSQPEGSLQTLHICNFVSALNANQVRELFELLQKSPKDTYATASSILLARYTEVEPARALTWAQRLPNSADRLAAYRDVFQSWRRSDASLLLATVNSITDPKELHEVQLLYVDALSSQNPAAALEYLKTLPADDQQRQAQLYLAHAWLNSDALAASQWMATLPSGDARDSIVAQLVSSQSEKAPETTFLWALTIDNDGLRAHNLRLATRELVRLNSAGAPQVLSAVLPADQCSVLLQQAQTDLDQAAHDSGASTTSKASPFPAAKPAASPKKSDKPIIDPPPDSAKKHTTAA